MSDTSTQLELNVNPITAEDITRSLIGAWLHRPGVIGSGVFLFNRWESDFVRITPAGFLTEYEIKISRSDFRADFHKTKKHECIANGDPYKHFWFVAPEGVIPIDEVPDYAGLMEARRRKYGVALMVRKAAPSLKGRKLPDHQIQRLYTSAHRKYYERY